MEYPIGVIAISVAFWGLAIARAHQRQQWLRQRATTPPPRQPQPTLLPPATPRTTPQGVALARSERLRYAQTNIELNALRQRLKAGAITDAEFHHESAALMATLSGWETPDTPSTSAAKAYRYSWQTRP